MSFLAVLIAYSDRVNISVAAVAMKEELGWTQTTKGLVLSSFFIGYMAFMFVSGWLATRLGGKRVLGIAVLWWSVFTLLTPLVATISLPALIAARIAIGLGEAAVFPAALELFGRWVPSNERTRAVAILMSGLSLGTVVGLLVTGWIVGRTGWPAAFYFFGVIGLLWVGVWFQGAVNDPAADVRVQSAERALLASGTRPVDPAEPLPWRALLLRPAVLALVLTHFATTWTLYVFLTWLPSYFRDALGLSIANSGMVSAAPWLAMFLMTYGGALISDAIVRRTGRVAFTRKLLQSAGLLGSAAMLLLAHQTSTVPMALAVICVAAGLLGLTWAGYLPNFLDLAPRHSAVLMGFSNTFATIPGIVAVALTGWLVDVTGTYTAAFVLAAAISLAGTLAYIVLGRAEPIVT
jgi:ACS family sodium-dependent inorganic phosphate cotransporter